MIMLSDWHPDVVEFIISKMQNIKILKWLKDNTKDELILETVNSKIEFENVNSVDKSIYRTILDKKELFNQDAIDLAERTIEYGGEWIVKDKEFLSGANISVNISDDFMKAVEKNGNWDLRFPDIAKMTKEQKEFYDEKWQDIGDVKEWKKLGYPVKVYKTMKAKELWNLISFCATYSAEPGIFFIDTANKFTNAKIYGQKVIATNPCGEQPLAPYSVCNLAAINLANFVNKETKEILWNKLKTTIQVAARMQDNVIDATPYFLEANKEQALGERRLGMGVMGLHDLLIWIGVRYGSDESVKILNKLFGFIANTAYETSADLAKEKGTFGFLTKDKWEDMSNTNFVKKLDRSVRDKIKANGLRNSHILTIAPTGSTGTMVGVSTGLEPYFALKFYRSGRLGKNVEIGIKIVEEWLNRNENKDFERENLPDYFVTAMELSAEEHVNIQTIIQKWIDSSISKTVNAPKGFTVQQVEDIYMMLFKGGAKGGTVYVDGSRDAQVLSLDSQEETKVETILPLEDIEKTRDIKVDDASLRGDRQDRDVGTKIGDICPICKEGTVVDSGGCTTCSNCGAQLSCGL